MPRSALALLAAPLALPGAAHAETAADPAWHLLGQIETQEVVQGDDWHVVKRFPAEIAGGADVFEISGYLIPVGWEAETRDFMLVSDLGQCPFCGSGEHGTAIEVRLADPLPVMDEERHARLRGALRLVTDPLTMQAVVMEDAVLLDG